MRNVLAAFWFVLLSACAGGGGDLPDQGLDQASQGGGIHLLPGERSSSSSSESSNGSSSNPSGTATTTPTASPPSSSNQAITTLGFDRSCNYDSDCVAVFQGMACQSCKCAGVAIATKEKSKYDARAAEQSAGCGAVAPCGTTCPNVTAACDTTTKTCTLRN